MNQSDYLSLGVVSVSTLALVVICALIHVTGTWILGLFDYMYYSATCYTTLGLGDLTPIGNIRCLTGMESLAGFVLIGWSVSFTCLEMDRFRRG